jgi:hypothetical protein
MFLPCANHGRNRGRPLGCVLANRGFPETLVGIPVRDSDCFRIGRKADTHELYSSETYCASPFIASNSPDASQLRSSL